jgi:polyferredoxin
MCNFFKNKLNFLNILIFSLFLWLNVKNKYQRICLCQKRVLIPKNSPNIKCQVLSTPFCPGFPYVCSPIYEYDIFLSLPSKIGLNAHSLIENVDINIVETFNAIVAKFVSGKRINYSQRSSYTSRSIAAAASFNLKGYFHIQLQKQISSDGPSTFL